MEAVSNLGNRVISGSKGSGMLSHQVSATNSASLVYMDEFDPAVATLNIVGSIDILVVNLQVSLISCCSVD